MQFLDVISVNIWAIIASLANLLILAWIIKRFLFKPVKKVVDARRAAIDDDYAKADAARAEAEELRLNYEASMAAAQQTSDQIIAEASRTAEYRSNEIVAEAREKATEIRRQAEADAVLERKKAEDEMKHEIADVSAKLRETAAAIKAAQEEYQHYLESTKILHEAKKYLAQAENYARFGELDEMYHQTAERAAPSGDT